MDRHHRDVRGDGRCRLRPDGIRLRIRRGLRQGHVIEPDLQQGFHCTYCVLMCPDVMPCPGPECYQADGLPTSVADSDECTGVDAGDQVLAPGTALTNTTASLREPAFPVPPAPESCSRSGTTTMTSPTALDTSSTRSTAISRTARGPHGGSPIPTAPRSADRGAPGRRRFTRSPRPPRPIRCSCVTGSSAIPCWGRTGVNCTSPASLYYDNLSLFAFTGVPPTPIFGLFPDPPRRRRSSTAP